jgi:CHAT domain-containing protein
LFPGARLLTGQEATETAVKQGIERYGMLHFATHGVSSDTNGLHSCLVLAPDSQEDGFLEAREMVEKALTARLAVLSACNTAGGQLSGGEGLLGLVWAFHAAGCPSVIASLWNVDDAATRELMVAFYRSLAAGKSVDEALRQAGMKMLRHRRYRAPYYWAAFQVNGQTQPVLASKPRGGSFIANPPRSIRKAAARR